MLSRPRRLCTSCPQEVRLKDLILTSLRMVTQGGSRISYRVDPGFQACGSGQGRIQEGGGGVLGVT